MFAAGAISLGAMAIGIGKATFHIGARNSGGWPFAARAQQSKMRRIGVLMSTAETDPLETVSLAAFNEELAKLGWTTSQNVTIDGAGVRQTPSR